MSMNERDLIELAAKAVGIKVKWAYGWSHTEEGKEWNPLTNDGDALRLAVKLNLAIQIEGEYSIASNFSGRISENQDHGKDPYAATRRAIVMAAAEIGKGME